MIIGINFRNGEFHSRNKLRQYFKMTWYFFVPFQFFDPW